MIIYPTIEILDGRCVSLEKGDIEAPLIWHVDPVETARSFAAAGAEWMHLTDLDAVRGNRRNEALVEEIIHRAGVPVQLGGGIRSRERAEHWIEKGAGRVVLGTMAAYDPKSAAALAKYHPDQIVLSVDIWQGQVMTEGWRKSGAWSPEGFIDAFEGTPFAGIVVTDIESDMGDVEAQLGLISHLAAHAKTPIIASGVVRTVDDISRLKYIHNIAGALVGRALFNKTLTVKEALETAQATPEKIAAFI